MELVTPDLGLLFWTGIVFCILLFLLAKFAWKPILGAVNTREEKITDALELAEQTKEEMKALQVQNVNLLKEARAERDLMIKDAKEISSKMVEDAKSTAKIEADKLMVSAKESINAEKSAAITELKIQVAAFSIEIAEKVVRGELASDAKQKALADKLAEDINMN
ncbi:MAG: F0F1 ATP synthase subunit B [Crocinitomicaceae bacterium]|nr:F0F1 ATP synthase subunit B [Crocinitomicaceae bacterium]